MRTRRATGFTLVEILIVVVILGILAAIVVPQFTNASQQAIKGALASQLQTINSQVELYRVQNSGNLPHLDPLDPVGGANEAGWGVLVAGNASGDYLKDQPNNGYTRSSNVIVQTGGASPAFVLNGPGWVYNDATGEVIAVGYNHDLNLLSNEAGYVDPAF